MYRLPKATEMYFPLKNSRELSFFTYIGAFFVSVWVLKLSWKLLHKSYEYICKSFNINVDWKTLPKWAVITGGSDGIGKAYAMELASKGFNLVLISKTAEKLQNVAADISMEFCVEVRKLCIDFTDNSLGPEIYKIIEKGISDLEIGVLVNNVGMSYEYPEYFHAIENGFEVIDKLISSNIISCTMMMRLVLPGMISRRKGVIINISSLIAVYPMPMLTVYSASKVYVDYLARAMHVEYKDKGIIIQSVRPGYVATNMSKRRVGVEVPTAEHFVKCAMETVGLETCTFGYFGHKIRGFVHEWLKANMPAKVNMGIILYYMQKGKDRYLKKKQRACTVKE